MELVNKENVLNILKSGKKEDEIINAINTMPTISWHYEKPLTDCNAIVERNSSYLYSYIMDYYDSNEGIWKCSDDDVVRWIPLFDIINIGEHEDGKSGKRIL